MVPGEGLGRGTDGQFGRQAWRSPPERAEASPGPLWVSTPKGSHYPDFQYHRLIFLIFELDINGIIQHVLFVCKIGVFFFFNSKTYSSNIRAL